MRDRNDNGKQGFDTSISDRRRQYPRDLPFTDLDFCGVCYADHRAKFVIEWKTWGCWHPDDPGQRANHDALLDLGDKATIAALVVMVSKAEPPQQWKYHICKANEIGDHYLKCFRRKHLIEPEMSEYRGEQISTLDEEDWLRFEFYLRGLPMDESQIARWKVEADLSKRIPMEV